MRVLVTGGLGNVGRGCLAALLEQGHQVRCLDISTKLSRKHARIYRGRLEVVWADLRDPDEVAAALQGQEAVIHLAFVLPPASDDRPEWAHEVNVGGTRNLLAAMKSLPSPPRIVFASSFSVFGDTQHLAPPRTVSDPVQPMDNYNRHKVECERLIQDSGLEWTILRLGVVPPSELGGFSPKMFDIPPGSRVEFAHPRDVGLALANSVSSEEARGRVLLIGGGERNQLYYRDFVGRMMEAMGVGRLPDSAFAPSASAYTDWLDTAESQRILQYQRHSFEDFTSEIAACLGYRRPLIRLLSPLIRRWMLTQSPHYRAGSLISAP